MTGRWVLVFPFTVSSHASSSAERYQQLRRTLQSVANCCMHHRHLMNLLQPLHQGPLTEGWVVPLISTEGNAEGLRQMAASWFGGLCHCWLLVKKKNGSCPAFTHKQYNKVDLQVFLFARQLSYISGDTVRSRNWSFLDFPECSLMFRPYRFMWIWPN